MADQYKLDLIYLLTPTSPDDRIDLVASKSTGFIYLVSLTGVTGARSELSIGLDDFVSRVRRRTHKPLCVGFGIANPEQARCVAETADGVIVGSRIVQLMEDIPELSSLIAGMRNALDTTSKGR